MKKNEHFDELCFILQKITDKKDMELFLRDILTPQEVVAISERWQVSKMILQGVKQRKIAEDLGVSIATVSRGSTHVHFGNGAFKKVFNQFFPKGNSGKNPQQTE